MWKLWNETERTNTIRKEVGRLYIRKRKSYTMQELWMRKITWINGGTKKCRKRP